MPSFVAIATGVGLFWVIQAIIRLPLFSGWWWVLIFGCILVGQVARAFYVAIRKDNDD